MYISKLTETAKSIGFLIFSGPESRDAEVVAGLANSALKRGLAVSIFAMHEGVMLAKDERYLQLSDNGAVITVCAHNASEMEAERTDKFKYGSQYDNSNIAGDCEKYVAFT